MIICLCFDMRLLLFTTIFHCTITGFFGNYQYVKTMDYTTKINPLWKESSINAITLETTDMKKSVSFYEKLGLIQSYSSINFTTMSVNQVSDNLHINIQFNENFKPPDHPQTWNGWGRYIFHVQDVDKFYDHVVSQGLLPEFEPTDADWGERYFQILDPMGHEISLAKRINSRLL